MNIKTTGGLGGSVLMLGVQMMAVAGVAFTCHQILQIILNPDPRPYVFQPAAISSHISADAGRGTNLQKSAPSGLSLPSRAMTENSRGSKDLAGEVRSVFPQLARPSGPFVSDPPGGVVNGKEYAHILDSGSYTVTTPLTGSMLVRGKALLYIPRNGLVKYDRHDVIKIARGASLTFCNDSSADATFGRFANDSHQAGKFCYYGLAGTADSKATFQVSQEFYGALYAPDQNLVLVGARGHDHDFYGSLVGNTVSLATLDE